MILKRISILNYKNLEQAELEFSPKMNCFIGQNGMGKYFTHIVSLSSVFFCAEMLMVGDARGSPPCRGSNGAAPLCKSLWWR